MTPLEQHVVVVSQVLDGKEVAGHGEAPWTCTFSDQDSEGPDIGLRTIPHLYDVYACMSAA